MEIALSFLHLVFIGFVSLLPPVNPIGTALIVDPVLHFLNQEERKAASRRIAVYCFFICACTLLVGTWLFKLFGVSLPVVQVAGGILICRMGWQLLSSNQDETESKEAASPEAASRSYTRVESQLFYPLSFPMTTGAGTISVLLTLSAHGTSGDWITHFINLGALLASVFLMCLMIYVSYAFTPALLRRLGPGGGQIVNRLSAFLVFCVGIQILAKGVTVLIRSP